MLSESLDTAFLFISLFSLVQTKMPNCHSFATVRQSPVRVRLCVPEVRCDLQTGLYLRKKIIREKDFLLYNEGIVVERVESASSPTYFVPVMLHNLSFEDLSVTLKQLQTLFQIHNPKYHCLQGEREGEERRTCLSEDEPALISKSEQNPTGLRNVRNKRSATFK